MRVQGGKFIDDCVCVSTGVYAIADEFSVLNKEDRVHVSLQTSLNGVGFALPKIKKGGALHDFPKSAVDSVVAGRYPIYTSLEDIFVVVTVSGDLIKGTNEWSDKTQICLYSPGDVVSGFSAKSPTKGSIAFTREHSIELTPCSRLTLGDTTVTFDCAVSLKDAILAVLKGMISSKNEFYMWRTHRVL